jgi:hypothetical protein
LLTALTLYANQDWGGLWNQSGHSEIDEEYKPLPDAIFSDVEMPDVS